VDLEVNYIENTIDINLYSEENATPYPVEIHYRMDINGSFEKPNERMTARLQYSCTVLDDCARTYLIKIYEMLSNHKPILYVIKDNLYDSANSKVEECYNLDNQTVDCKNGLCRAEVGLYIESDHPFDPIPYYRTYCDYYPPGDPFYNKTGLSTINTYGLPTPLGVFNTIHYVCNKNLCNNDENIKLIRNLLVDYNNFDVPTNITTTAMPSNTITTTFSTITMTIITTLLFVIKDFFIY